MAKQRATVPADAWSHSEGERGLTVRVAEAWDKGGQVYLWRTVGRKPVKRALSEYLGQKEPFVLRNARGEILAGQRKRAIDAAKACVADLRSGLDPFRGSRAPAAPPVDLRPTVKTALDEALRGTGGMFVSDSEHRRAMLRVSDKVLAALRTGLGPNDFPLCEEVVPGTSQTIWRYLLGQATNVRDGVREAEKCVALLYQVLRWLHERFPNRYPVGKRPLKDWKRLLRNEWESRFGERYETEEDAGLRFTEEETRKIFAFLARADPRLALMIEIGPDQRAGQVIRATRRDLDLRPGTGGLGFGRINLLRHSRGKKATTIIDLHEASRAAVDRAIGPDGYLHELEAAFQAGEVADYHLWPAGRMHRDGMRLWVYLKGGRKRSGPQHASSTSLIKSFRTYQEQIGVELVPGRQFHGLRRVLSDLAEDVEKDTRALREMVGWKDEDTRRRYQRRRDPKITAKAAVARARIRELLSVEDLPAAPDAGPDLAGFSEAELQILLERVQKRLAGEPK